MAELAIQLFRIFGGPLEERINKPFLAIPIESIRDILHDRYLIDISVSGLEIEAIHLSDSSKPRIDKTARALAGMVHSKAAFDLVLGKDCKCSVDLIKKTQKSKD